MGTKIKFYTFPSTSSFMITAGGSTCPSVSGNLESADVCEELADVCEEAKMQELTRAMIYLLVATTLLMKSVILMVTTDVVPSPSFQLSTILPPIPTKVTVIIIVVRIAKFGILCPSFGPQ